MLHPWLEELVKSCKRQQRATDTSFLAVLAMPLPVGKSVFYNTFDLGDLKVCYSAGSQSYGKLNI